MFALPLGPVGLRSRGVPAAGAELGVDLVDRRDEGRAEVVRHFFFFVTRILTSVGGR